MNPTNLGVVRRAQPIARSLASRPITLLALVFAVVVALAVQGVAVPRSASAATAPAAGLYYSTTADRANPRPLAGATLSGSVYVFGLPSGSLTSGTFTLDGMTERVENSAPYDFQGSETSGAPRAWDTTGKDGSHTIAFSGSLLSGGQFTTSASFHVGTSPSAPAPQPPATRPGPSNTGVPEGTVLRRRGSLTVTTPGAVLDRLDISGSVLIKAPNVVIRRSRIHGTGVYGVRVASGSVTIEDSEIYGFGHGIAFSNWTARRVDIHSMTVDGVKLGKNTRLVSSYIHHFRPAPGAHADGAQLQDAGAENVVVSGNTIDLANPGVNSGYGGNSAIILKPDLGALSPRGGVLVQGNYLNGGNFTLYLVRSADRQLKNVAIRDNRFGRVFRYGPRSVNTPCTWTNNVWDDSGQPLLR